MAFDPVDVTDGNTVKTVHSPSELNQALWQGWVTVLGTVPVVYDGGSAAQVGPNMPGFLELLANTFVAKRDLVISADRPTSAPDGTVHIKNSTDA